MRNDESVLKKFKSFSFFDENSAEKQFWQKLSQHAYQLNGVPKISATTLDSETYCEDRTQKTPFAV